MKNRIKILGCGDVVKFFLKSFKKDFPNVLFEIYCRSARKNKSNESCIFRDISTYQQDAHPTFFCCSINEIEQLKNARDQSSRLAVARSNLQLIRTFIEKGFFKDGLHFILTNPSELITEYIIRQTKNKNIFALGLSVDLKRYHQILPQFNIDTLKVKFNVIGNHWDSPLVNFEDDFSNNSILLLKKLILALKNKIRTEFQGFKPPKKSGATVIYDALYGLYHRKNFQLSGFIEKYDIVSGGILSVDPFKFTQPKIHRLTNTLLLNAINTHKKVYINLMEKIG